MLARKSAVLFAASAVALSLLSGLPGSVAVAQPETAVSHLDHIDRPGQRQQVFHVYSAAMDRIIPLQILTAFDQSEPRPTLYLLNGAGGGEDLASWYNQTDIVQFLGAKNVNVVTPSVGAFSYYTDWQRDDPKLGRNKWETFLTRELPPIIDAQLGASGVNAIAGVSMSATSVLYMAGAAPDLYRAVGSFSGCASTLDSAGRTYIDLVLARAGASPKNMWGENGDPAWRDHDAVLNAERLRGKAIYLSSATGLPGEAEEILPPYSVGQVMTKANQMVLGGLIEAATNTCTHQLADRLAELGIPAQLEYRAAGSHTWHYWEQDLHRSWPMFAAALGIS